MWEEEEEEEEEDEEEEEEDVVAKKLLVYVRRNPNFDGRGEWTVKNRTRDDPSCKVGDALQNISSGNQTHGNGKFLI